jgi:hypothetical protein
MRLPLQSTGIGRSAAGAARIGGTVLPMRLEGAFRRSMGPGRFIIRGTLTATPGDGASSCVCFRVCDGAGENCTECFCDPPSCGACD